jgi:Domain of unknown function (DUF4062)/AAA ATPase domain
MAKVFVGSTSRDLHGYRQAAIDECNRLGLVPIAMEFFEAIGVGATAGSRRKLDEADVYVGIFAHRYGYVEPGEAASVTELEFDYAGEPRKLERLCFLADPENADPALLALAEPEQKERIAAFHARIEAAVIREHFTSVDDFRGKIRLALQAWMRRTPVLRGPQPPLSFQLLEATPENRLRYGARQTPFVGRTRELELLRAFLEETAGLSWLVVAGPAGSGKSRLVQELCTSVSPPWRAGFLLAEPPFAEWSGWQPEGPTLMVVDYAAEQVDRVRALLSAAIHRGADAFARTPVRVLLVERDADGPWIDRLIGSRSAGYALEQTRSSIATVEVGPLSDEELWRTVAGLLDPVAADGRLRADLITALHALDPMRRPLFALLAADAVTAGRSIGAWDRERLLRDVLARDRETWAARGVTAAYENLLALATMTGGLTEAVLETPLPEVALPGFREFDRALYRAMTGADLAGDALPPLKPDLLGEFFVLEHVRGRNPKITARLAAELGAAAWRVRGGGRRIERFGLTHVLPSGLPLFLRHVVDDYIDHAATPQLLAKPDDDGIDLFFWPELVAHGIDRLAAAGRLQEAIERFDELTAMTPQQQQELLGTSNVIAAAFALLPHALAPGALLDPDQLLARIGAVELRSHDGTAGAFAQGVADAVPALIAAGRADLAEQMLGRVLALTKEHPGDDELRARWARGTAQLVITERPLEARERAFARLLAFCQERREEVALYVHLALAAGALCREYLADSARLADAEHMNRVIRGLARLRGEQRLVRISSAPEEDLGVRTELVHEDLRTIRLELADTNARLIDPWIGAERVEEASRLLDEIDRLAPRGDPDFAFAWAFGVAQHANASARAGRLVQVPKALSGIAEVAAAFPGHPRFARTASMLALVTLKRAAEQNDGALAAQMLEVLEKGAGADDPDACLIADYAEGALVASTRHQERGDDAEAMRIAHAARWALRSPAATARWQERGGESAVAEITAWLDAIDAAAAAST